MALQKIHETVELKALGLTEDKTKGQFLATVAAYGNVDLQGDRVMEGSWDASMERKKAKGDRIPVIWSHDWGDPLSFVGSVDPANVKSVKDVGYQVLGDIDLRNERGRQVYKLLGGYGDEPLVKEFSFAYDVREERTGEDYANELVELDIIELGPTLKGANSDAVLLGVKADASDHETKAVDNSSWDGPAAMSRAGSAESPAAAFRAICAGRKSGPPEQAASWALPHHKSPGSPPNAAGVRNALARFGQTQGLQNSEAARSHLEAHMRSVQSEQQAASGVPDDVKKVQAVIPVSPQQLEDEETTKDLFERKFREFAEQTATTDSAGSTMVVGGNVSRKAGRVLSAKNEALLRQAVTSLGAVLEALAEPEPEGSAEEKAVDPPVPDSDAGQEWLAVLLKHNLPAEDVLAS